MGVFKDLTGQKFGRLTVISRAPAEKPGHTKWICRCDCGSIKAVQGTKLKNGETSSCGCLHREMMRSGLAAKMAAGNRARRTHGMCGTRLYGIWNGMKQRCSNPNTNRYQHYGARGIAVCKEWADDFENFKNWAIANGYRDDLTIDRIDTEKGYSPDNCRWATQKEQQNNRRNNRRRNVCT